jgi:hypothetical protein
MAIQYKYYGILYDGDTHESPSGVIRSWVHPNGRKKAEAFTRSLTWEASDIFSPWSDDHQTIVDIDESVVERFIEELKAIYGSA